MNNVETGSVYSRLTTLSKITLSGKVRWRCICTCGNLVEIRQDHLISGATKSCGCLNKEKRAEKGRASCINLLGRVFGHLTVTSRAVDPNKTYVFWECLCSCGNTLILPSYALLHKNKTSCGCKHKNNIEGNTYGYLTALYPTEKRYGGSIVWACLCKCGTMTEAPRDKLNNGGIKSCGCLAREVGIRTAVNIEGKSCGYLTALYGTEERKGGGVLWMCRCVCGNYTKVKAGDFNGLFIKSCGCMGKGNQYLYAFLSNNTGLIKIGVSHNPLKRKESLAKRLEDSLSLLGFSLGGKPKETEIHNLLKRHRAIHPNQPKGKEWFHPAGEVVALLQHTLESEGIYANLSSLCSS